MRPIRSECSTPWRQILTFGKAEDLIVSIKIAKVHLIERVLTCLKISGYKLILEARIEKH